MMNICWANTDSFDDAEIVIVGIPDESKSHALRKGTSEAPHKIQRSHQFGTRTSVETTFHLAFLLEELQERFTIMATSSETR